MSYRIESVDNEDSGGLVLLDNIEINPAQPKRFCLNIFDKCRVLCLILLPFVDPDSLVTGFFGGLN